MELHLDNEAARLMGYEVVEDETPNEKIFLPSSCEIADGIIREESNYWWKMPMKVAYELRGDGGNGVWEKDEPVGNSDPLKEDNMDKPRICEVLGVEVGEPFGFNDFPFDESKEFMVDENGEIRPNGDGCITPSEICCIINNADCIIRKPRFTKQEVEFARLFKAACKNVVWIQRKDEKTLVWVVEYSNDEYRLPFRLFPSILPGQSYTLDEIIGGAE